MEHYNIDLQGKNVVVIGRSNIVGKPLSFLLQQKNATVTVVHSYTQDLKKFTKIADILICAVGKANFITSDYIKDGVTLIDVGINKMMYGNHIRSI